MQIFLIKQKEFETIRRSSHLRQLQPKRVDTLEDGVKLGKTQWGEVRAENNSHNRHICFLYYSRGFESWYSHVDVVCLIVLEAFGLRAFSVVKSHFC
jgi:hypothetical protein